MQHKVISFLLEKLLGQRDLLEDYAISELIRESFVNSSNYSLPEYTKEELPRDLFKDQ